MHRIQSNLRYRLLKCACVQQFRVSRCSSPCQPPSLRIALPLMVLWDELSTLYHSRPLDYYSEKIQRNLLSSPQLINLYYKITLLLYYQRMFSCNHYAQPVNHSYRFCILLDCGTFSRCAEFEGGYSSCKVTLLRCGAYVHAHSPNVLLPRTRTGPRHAPPSSDDEGFAWWLRGG